VRRTETFIKKTESKKQGVAHRKKNMTQSKLNINNYQIHLVESAGLAFDEWIKDKEYSSIFIFTDENVLEHCWPKLQNDSDILKEAELIVIPPGESQKDLEMAHQLWQMMIEYGADRKSLWVNFGGGMISDLGGFVAPTYKRGIDFVNIPTTLLSMIDASVGGKTGINLGHFKNQIGVFNNPKSLWLQADFLDSLNERQLINGWAEMLKHSLISDQSQWDKLSKITELNSTIISKFLLNSIEVKKNIVEEDPLEKNVRKKLNFGHTIGHAIESWSLEKDEFPLLHGEAVAIGMITESYLSVKNKQLSKADFNEILQVFQRFFTKYQLDMDFLNHIENLINQDKKKEGNKLNFTFVHQIGQSLINQDASLEDIKESIVFYKENF